jgi:hypothetical protein
MRNQREIMMDMFKQRPNQRIPLYDLMKIASQYNARIHELRLEGMNIRNYVRVVNGVKHTWYEYLPEGELIGASSFNGVRSQP